MILTKQNILILFVLMGVCSCKSPSKQILEFGMYKTKNHTQIETTLKRILFNEVFPSTIILQLKRDSSFVYTTCGNFMQGYFRVENDSLLLMCKSNTWNYDTSKVTYYEIPVLLQKMEIRNKKVIGKNSVTINSHKRLSIEELELIQP